jgi:hypothetical protein
MEIEQGTALEHSDIQQDSISSVKKPYQAPELLLHGQWTDKTHGGTFGGSG